jgi:YgiT-type zinc finger domain-containing protein
MKCVICKTGDTAPGKVTVTLQRGEATVLIKGVPAEVCDDCGEYYLSEETSQRVLKQAESAIANHAELEVLRFAA